MVAALLHGGRDAVLSHRTAAWWWGLIDDQTQVVEISTPGRASSTDGVLVHRRRRLETTRHRRFPITSLRQTLLDLAAVASLATIRRALARADYLGLLDAAAVAEAPGQGRAGSTRLRKALDSHLPRLAHTRSQLEEAFLLLIEKRGLPLPELNQEVEGWTVDALWRKERVIVELDGYGNHRSRAQMERDRRKELALRAAGFLVLRYTWEQVTDEANLVLADLLMGLRGY